MHFSLLTYLNTVMRLPGQSKQLILSILDVIIPTENSLYTGLGGNSVTLVNSPARPMLPLSWQKRKLQLRERKYFPFAGSGTKICLSPVQFQSPLSCSVMLPP